MIIVRVIIFQRAAVEITVSAEITRALPTKLPVVMIAKDGKDRHPMIIVWQMPQSSRMTHWTKPAVTVANRIGQSREIYSNSVPLSPPHWPYPKRIRPPSWPRVAVASSTQNTKLFTWRTWPGAGAVPKCDWAARSQCGFKQRRADHTKYIWYVATHGQSVITTELMIA